MAKASRGCASTQTRLLDLNGDGSKDWLLAAHQPLLEVRLHTGARRFQKVAQDLPQVQLTDVLVTDLDGDGHSDLYLVTPEADVALLGDGTGLFRDATRTSGLVENGVGVSAERLDLDGDGLLELVLHNRVRTSCSGR